MRKKVFNSTENQEAFSKQVPKNLIANSLYFGINVIIGLFLIPYFIGSLGVASYALIPLATSLTSYVNLIVQSLNTSVSRYMTIELQKEELEKANVIFNTALFGTFVVVLLILPLALLVCYYTPSFFGIPENQENSARILFLGVMSAFLLRAWGSNFGISLFAYNRLDLQNVIDTINILTQVGLIILLFNIFSPNLIYIGIAYLISSIVSVAITILFSRKINPYLRVNIRNFRRSKVKEITETSAWIIITQIGALLFLQIDLIVVNKLFGTLAGGEYSIALTWSTLLRTIGGMLAGILTPVVLTYYAKDKIYELVNISKIYVKLVGYTMALPIGYICGFAPQLLSLWVGPEFVILSPLMLLMLSHLIINLPVMSLFSINIAYNKVKIPAIVTFFMGIGNFLLAIIIPHFTNSGYYGVAVAGAIMLTLKNALFTPWYAAKVLGSSRNTFISSIYPCVLAMLIVAGVSYMINDFFHISELFTLVLCGITLTMFYIFAVFCFGLTKKERKIIEVTIPFKLRDKKAKLETQSQ